MWAIDTNVIVRFITRDDAGQSARARAMIEAHEVFVATTVLLEVEWVLRSVYGFDRETRLGALCAFVGLPQVKLEAGALVTEALEMMAKRMDFADALHLAMARGCDGFASFDRRLARAAAALGGMEVREP
jgi:predicted nucleic-acid-binding protein